VPLPYSFKSRLTTSLRLTTPILLACSCLFVSPLYAQQGRGVIAGHVTDSAGAALWSARVELQPLALSAKSDDQGQFIFVNLAPGDYDLIVSYVGFTTFTRTAQVTAGRVARVDVQMKVGSQPEEITVTAERGHGEAEAINLERTSDNILQVLPFDVITSLPNTNVADALGRLPSVTLERDEGEGKYVQIRGLEPRLSNVTVNGINIPSPESGVRQIKLDVIPANLVESVEINKTLSANQDGDAIGGSVDLITKTAGESPTLYLNGIGGYTPIESGRTLSEFDGSIGKRFGASKKLGILIGGSYDWNGRGIDDVEPSLDVFDNQPVAPAIDLREYRYYRSRYGFAGSVDYKLSDASGLYLRFIYSHFDNFGDRWVYSPETGLISPTQGDGNGDVSFGTQIRRPVEVIGSLSAGGKHVFTKSWLSYEASVSRASSEDRSYSTAKFDGPSGILFSLDRSDPFRPKLIPQGGVNIFDPTAYTLNNLEISKAYSPQLNLQGAASWAMNYSLAGHSSTFEFGGKLRNAHKFNDANDFIFDSNTNPALSNFLGSFTNPDYYDKSYTLGPTADFSKIRTFFNSSPGAFTLNQNDSILNTLPNNYDLVERISAGYVMNTVTFGRVRLQTGVRFEGTQEDVLGNFVQVNSDGTFVSNQRQRNTSSYVDVLPSAQLRFGLGQDSAIRLVYGRGIARPDFGDLPPFKLKDDSANKVSVGNPDLRPTRSNSFDFLFEQYLKPLGLLEAGFFYKDLSNPIYVVDSPSKDFPGFTQEQSVNGSSAHLTGIEIAYQQHLSFLPGVMSGLGIAANYSYTTSRAANVPLRSDNPPLQRQAPNTWNVSPTYDRKRLSVRVGISHNDANIFQYNFQDGAPLGKKGPFGDVYLYAHTQVDAQGSFRMYRGLRLIVSGLNLTNEVFGFYQGSPQFPIQREFYKPSYSFGLRYTLSNERK
jgi:TonB-dependent receptor